MNNVMRVGRMRLLNRDDEMKGKLVKIKVPTLNNARLDEMKRG